VDIGAYEFHLVQPTLQIAPVDGGIHLSWLLWASNFVLQQSGAAPVSWGGWSNVNATLSTTTNNETTLLLPFEGNSQLYPLFKP
jgi:hypothetical protein